MDVKTALTNFETANDALVAADGALDSAKAKQADAQSKLDAAVAGTASAAKADDDAAAGYNSSIDDLVAALNAAKRVPTPPAA